MREAGIQAYHKALYRPSAALDLRRAQVLSNLLLIPMICLNRLVEAIRAWVHKALWKLIEFFVNSH